MNFILNLTYESMNYIDTAHNNQPHLNISSNIICAKLPKCQFGIEIHRFMHTKADQYIILKRMFVHNRKIYISQIYTNV